MSVATLMNPMTMIRRARFFFSLLLVGGTVVAQPRTDTLINNDWQFLRANTAGAERREYAETGWRTVTLPHTWNGRDGQDGGNDYYRGVGWYRKHLCVDKKFSGKSIFLKFDGVGTTASVYVNGKLAGSHKGAFGAFCFDVTSLVTFADSNTIAVKVSNAKDTTLAPLRGDFTVFGGMYRDVHLIATDPLSISPVDFASSGVYVEQKSVSHDSASLLLRTVLRNGGQNSRTARVVCTLRDAGGKAVTEGEKNIAVDAGGQTTAIQNLVVSSPRLWEGKNDPYMYELTVDVYDRNELKDRVSESIGLRSFSVRPDSGFYLNGHPYRLFGVNRHQDRENKGWAIGMKEHREDLALIEEIGATAVRLAHYQQAREVYDLCDQKGLAVWAELCLVDEINPAPEFATNGQSQLRELILQNYNHPSIFFWSVFNELMPDADRPLYGRVVKSLDSLAHALDPFRLTTMASRSKYEPDEYINTITDIVGYNVYRGWYEGQPEDFTTFADGIHKRFPALRFCISEYGAGGGIQQHEWPAKKPSTRGAWHPEEWQSIVHEVTWNAIASRPYLWGSFVWNMFDFASDGRTEGEFPGRNDKGLVTYDRKIRKDVFYWYKANWNPEPMVHITGKRYVRRPSGSTDVKIYSNCDSVRLTINGKVCGTQIPSRRTVVWSGARLHEGSNAVVATAFINGVAIKDSCVWEAGPPFEARRESDR
jgi:beta-galactosidase